MAIYTLEVFITSGLVTEKFLKRNPIISRTIEIMGEQTLDILHGIIFDAFDRSDDHLYEFQLGGEGPDDPEATIYRFTGTYGEESGSDEQRLKSTQTTIQELNLKIGDRFGYIFDFGDYWEHQINVLEIEEKPASGKRYPRVTQKEGANPPQYLEEE